MDIVTESGIVRINKKTPYGKWFMGYKKSGAWSGWFTLKKVWENRKDEKPIGCSWKAWGYICGKIQNATYYKIE